MKKIWLGGKAYRLTDEQDAEMNADLKKALIPPHGTGDKSVTESENLCIKWLQGKKIAPVKVLLLLLASAACWAIDKFILDNQGAVLGQLFIAALTTGAAVNTVSPAQTQLESDIEIGDIDTANPLRGLTVNVDGDTSINIQGSQPLMSVFSKLGQYMTGSGIIGLITKIATGRVFCKAAVVTFTNNGATTPAVYWNSQKGVGKPGRLIRARTTTINPNSNQTFLSNDFAYLAVTDPANVTSFDVTFSDGTQQPMTVIEMDSLFAKTNETEANGRLDAVVTCVDNTLKTIQQVRVNVGAVAVTIMWVI